MPPWDLTDAIDQGETDAALKVLHRLMEAGARHPLVVLAILHRHFGNVLRVQSPGITTEGQAAEALGIAKGRSTFPARKALNAARRLGASGSADAVIALADAELALKGKLEWEPELVLEVLVARLCRLSRASRGSLRPSGRARQPSRPLGQPRRPERQLLGPADVTGPGRLPIARSAGPIAGTSCRAQRHPAAGIDAAPGTQRQPAVSSASGA